MPEPDIDVDIKNQSVNVHLNVSTRSPRRRFYACMFFTGIWAALICALLLLPRNGGRASIWQDVSPSPVDSEGFIFLLIILVSCSVLMVLLTWRYIVLAYPSDEAFHCDSLALTTSKVRWLDISNKRWDTHSYTLASVQEMEYEAIAHLRGTSIYGLRLIAGGKTHRILPGLKPRQADQILKALKALGIEGIDDSTLLRKLAEDSNI